MMEALVSRIFELSRNIRYVALYRYGELVSDQRSDLQGASSSESDRYEELIVNPTLITLLRQRGDIDCGGLDYVVVRYGGFFQLVVPTAWGHASIAFEPAADPLGHVEPLRSLLAAAGAVS